MEGAEGLPAAVPAILKDIFGSSGLDVAPCAPAEITGPSATAIVGIIGKPGKLVVIKAGEKLALALAGAMLMSEYAAWNDEVRDAFSELANMAAGNIKARCFPEQGFKLSLPTVIYGGDYRMSPARMRTLAELAFESCGEKLLLRVAEES